jgi:hypothetical protein
MAGARLANLPRGGHRHGEVKVPAGTLTVEPVSIEAAAELMGTSVRCVKRAKRVLRQGIPELVAAVDADVVSLRAAERPRRLRRSVGGVRALAGPPARAVGPVGPG